MKLLASLCAGALACALSARACASTLESVRSSGGVLFLQGLQEPGLDFAALRPTSGPALKPGLYAPEALAAPLHRIALAPELNNIRRTASTFDAGGATVHVFGDKSQNKNSWFLGFAVQGGDTQFLKGEKLLNWMFIKHEAEVALNGQAYRIKVHGQMRNRMQSKISIEPRDKRGTKTILTVERLSESIFAAGRQLRIGGREFRLIYTENFNEDDHGDFAGYTGERSIVLMFRDGAKLKGYHWFERSIPADRVLVDTPRTADENDAYSPGSFTLGLRIHQGFLELYQ